MSPITYQRFTCPQIAEEMQRVSSRAAQAAGVQDSTASKDALAMAVGLVVDIGNCEYFPVEISLETGVLATHDGICAGGAG
jgi:hypothetical protein